MPKQHHPNNELTDGGANHPSSNNDAWPHDTPRTDDDVILLTPINQNQPTVAKTKQPAVAKPKPPAVSKPKQQPSVSKTKPPSVKQEKKQNTNSNSSYNTPQKQPTLPPRIVPRHVSQKGRQPFTLSRFCGKLTEKIILIVMFVIFVCFMTYMAYWEKSTWCNTNGKPLPDNPLTILWELMKPKTASQRAFQEEWKKIEQEEAAGITPEIYKPNKEKPKAEKAVGEEKKRKTEKTAAVDSAESTTEQAVESTTGQAVESTTEQAVESTTGDANESSSEDSETEDDNDDLVMDFLKRKMGTVSGKPSSQRTRQIRRPPNPVLQQYMPRGSWSPGNLSRHWAKHGHEFPEYGSEAEYGRGALYFFEHPPPGTLRKTRGNGDCLFYNPRTNTFGVTTADGTPKTMFRPDNGMDYWNRQ